MSISFNKVIMGGRLTADPVLQTTNSGVNYTRFSLAVDKPYQKGKERQADFIHCIAWRQTADFLSKYGKKGTCILVEGTLQSNAYEKNGVKVDSYNVVADIIKIDFPPKTTKPAQLNGSGYDVSDATTATNGFSDYNGEDDDLPF